MKIKRIALSLISCFALLVSSIPSTAVFVSAIDGKAQQLTLMTSEDFQESTTGNILFANGISITVKPDPDNPNQNIVTCDDDGSTMSVSTGIHIFAGSHNTDAEKGPVKITVDGAKIGSVWGGGMHKSHVSNVEIVVKSGSNVKVVQGGGSASNSAITKCTEDCSDAFYKGDANSSPCVVDNATITVEDGATVSSVFGGGEGISNTKNTTVNIKGGDIKFVGAGGSNGRTGTANVNIEGGNIDLVQSVNRGTMDSAEIDVSGGTIGELFIGGEDADDVKGTITSSTVKVTGGTVESLAPGKSGDDVIDAEAKGTFNLEISKEADVNLSEDFAEANIGVLCEHNLKQVAFAKESTCTEKGSTDGWQCQNCNKYFKDDCEQEAKGGMADFETELKAHTYKVQKIEKCPNPTASADGPEYTYYVCEVCGGYFSDESGTKIGDGSIEQAVTELQKQATANGHTPVVLDEKAATCSQTGLTKGLKCSACGEVFIRQETTLRNPENHVDANGEDAWGEAELNPTDDDKATQYPGLDADGNFDCTQGGWTRQVCEECGAHKYAYVTPKEAHNWSEPTVVPDTDDHDADCTNPGQGTKKCTNPYCTATETDVIEAKGHDFKIKAQVEAKCDTDGTKLHWECANCDVWSWDADGEDIIENHDDVKIAKYQHRSDPEDPDTAYSIEVEGKAPTCTESGYSSYKQCKWCGEMDPDNSKKTLPINEYGHAYDSLADEAQEATCEADGKYAYFQCKYCQQYILIKPEAITEANPNGYVAVEGGKEPTAEQLKIPAKGHQFPLTQVSERGDATCTDGGAIDGWQCEACKKYFKDANAETEVDSLDDFNVEATGHSWQKVEASCTREAYYYCTVCGQLAKILEVSGEENETLDGSVYLKYIESITEVLKAGQHTWNPDRTAYKAPTCEDIGNYGSVTCSECNATYKTTDDKGNPIESELNYVEISNPEELVIAALGHDYGELIDEVPATCTDEGTAAHYKCSACEKLFKNDDDKTETDASGLVITAKGHQYGELIAEDKDRNVCTEPGMKDHYQCSECEKYFTDKNPESEIEREKLVIPAKGHQSEVYVQAKAATCTDPGSTEGTRCSVCNVVLIPPTVTPKLGHEFKEENYKTKTPATCEEKEIQEAKCTRCDVTQTREKPDSEPLGHEYQKVEAKEATCTEPGNIEYYKCSRCTKLFVEVEGVKNEVTADKVVTTKDHEYGELIEEVPATCTEEGTKAHYQCSECEKLFVDENTTQDDGTSVTTKKEVTAAELVIEKIAHTVVVDEAVEATCTKIGYTEGSHCSVCNTVIKEQIVIPMKLHTPVTDEAVEATCTKSGLTEGKHCSVCGGVIVVQSVIPALGHNYKNGVCTRDGVKDPNYVANSSVDNGNSNTGNNSNSNSNITTKPANKIPAKALKVKQAKIKKLKVKSKAKKTINVNWKKVSGAKGYEVEVSKSSKFKKNARVLKKTTKKLKLTIKNKKIKSKKTYYVRVRAYTTYKSGNSTNKAYSSWNYVLRKVKVK